jgi:predicted GH43/DUF377 family glycosyl hydrolase
MEDQYITYVSFKDKQDNTVLRRNVVLCDEYELPEKGTSLTDAYHTGVQYRSANLSVLPLFDASAEEFNASVLSYNTITGTWTNEYECDNPEYRVFYTYRKRINDHSTLWIVERSSTEPLCIFTDPHIHYEDPRMFPFKGQLYISYSFWGSKSITKWTDPSCSISIGFTEFTLKNNGQFEKGQTYIPAFGDNTVPGKKEKNWTFFQYGSYLHCLYSVTPLVIFSYNLQTNECFPVPSIQQPLNLSLRGGTPPVCVGKKYVSFVHCSDYLIYKLVFEYIDGKFQTTFISKFPIALGITTICDSSGSQYNTNKILFPCGAIYDRDQGEYLITMGLDDKLNALYFL